MLELLSDGQWHQREQVITAGMAAVPPGIAWRDAEANRLRTTSGPRTRGDDETAVSAGARHITTKALDASLVRRRHVTRSVSGDLYRLARPT